jgi:hypothetical protein
MPTDARKQWGLRCRRVVLRAEEAVARGAAQRMTFTTFLMIAIPVLILVYLYRAK